MKKFDHADARPRIYLRRIGSDIVSWSLSPNGIGTPTPSVETAIANALAAVGEVASVIFWEPGHVR